MDGATSGSIVAIIVLFLFVLVLTVFLVVAMWRLYTKAGQPGWAAIVPFYNVYVLLKIVGRPGWWLVLFFIPLVNIVFMIIVMVDLATAFGRGGGFAVLLILLPWIAYPILAFGSSTYRGPVAAVDGPGNPPSAPGYPASQYHQQQYPPRQYPQQQYPPQQYPPRQ